jgi:hypothetical protein
MPLAIPQTVVLPEFLSTHQNEGISVLHEGFGLKAP